MIDRICLGLTLPLLLGAVQGTTQPAWKVVEFKEGRFSVAFPSGYTEKKQKVARAGEALEVNMVIGEGRNEVLFVVSYCDYSEADLKKGPVAKRLDHARDGAVSSAGGSLRYEKKCELEGHPGRDLAISKEGELVVRTRLFLVKNRLYQLMTVGKLNTKETEAFFDSFSLIK